MTRTSSKLQVLVGEDKTPLTLTDSAVEAVQGEAAGRAVDGFAGIWKIEETIDGGEGWDSLDLPTLLELRDHVQVALEMVEVLIECRPLDELDAGDES